MTRRSMNLTAYQLCLFERALRQDAIAHELTTAHGDLIAFLETADCIRVTPFTPACHKARKYMQHKPIYTI